MLHSRPYKERSVIADFLVQDHGRISMVVQGVRKTKSRTAPLVQPFTRVLLSWRGRSDLKTLTSIESSQAISLKGKHLFSGFYLNELLVRSVLSGQELEGVFDLYEMVLSKLTDGGSIEPVLRLFELELLSLTGYAPPLETLYTSGDPVEAGSLYRLHLGEGLYPVIQPNNNEQNWYFSGELLLALAARDFSRTELYPGFKRFTRLALSPLVGSKPLKSRALFRSTAREK